MPFDLPLPVEFRKARWKVKIREKETREPPHVTILRDARAWRINLRTGEFMDDQPSPSEVPNALLEHIRQPTNWSLLCGEGDRKYPANPVSGQPDEENQ